MSITFGKAWGREQERAARAFVYQYGAPPEWACGDQTPEERRAWFETAIEDPTLSYIVGVDDDTGAVVGAHVSSQKVTEDQEGVSHWRRVQTIVIEPGLDLLAMHWNLTREFMATVPEGGSWVCNCDRPVYEAVKDQPTMNGAIARSIPNSLLGSTMLEVVGYHLDELPDLIEIP